MQTQRLKFTLEELDLKLDENILKTLAFLNTIFEQQNTKPTKLYTDGKTGTIYTHASKIHLQKLIKKIKTELIEKEIDEIFTSDILKRISEIEISTPQIVKEIPRKQKKKSICCKKCGEITFVTEEQYTIIKSKKGFICPGCGTRLKIKG